MRAEKWRYLTEWMRVQNLVDNKLMNAIKVTNGEKVQPRTELPTRLGVQRNMAASHDASKAVDSRRPSSGSQHQFVSKLENS